jgi:hypothetical protein
MVRGACREERKLGKIVMINKKLKPLATKMKISSSHKIL